MEESPRSPEGREAAETLEQEMGRRSVAEAMRPLRDRTPSSSSSVAGPVTHRLVAEACDTLVREKHQASPPEWPGNTGPLANVNQAWKGERETLREPPSIQRKTVSTPRSGGEGSPRRPEPDWSRPPQSGNSGRPRPWRSSWEAEQARGIATGIVH